MKVTIDESSIQSKIFAARDICQKNKVTWQKRYARKPFTNANRAGIEPWKVDNIDQGNKQPLNFRFKQSGKIRNTRILTLAALEWAGRFSGDLATQNSPLKVICSCFWHELAVLIPCLKEVVYCNGNKLIKKEFRGILESYTIKYSPTAMMNPQANATTKRIHLGMGNVSWARGFEGDD
mmetsp:Transcript_26928/g.39693  ORF Transcript_26928/g.39693 Transcript_26928/m.39693 type:complete len:179 (-) Transcript_26928:4-540(-)